jgi:hypothetical protein
MKYFELLEECKNIYTELSYSSRFTRIAMFHLLGKTVIENDLNPEKISNFAIAIGIEPSDLAIAILFAEKYPNLDNFNHDKTISWSQIVKELSEKT